MLGVVNVPTRSSAGSLVQDDNKMAVDDGFEKTQSTNGESVFQPEVEEEQFSFSDIGDCKSAETCPEETSFRDTVKVDENEVSVENSVEDSKVLSEPIDIERKKISLEKKRWTGWLNHYLLCGFTTTMISMLVLVSL